MPDELISDLLLLLTAWAVLRFWPICQKSWCHHPPKRRRKRSGRREKIPGLTKKPDCAQCQAAETQPLPPTPPPYFKSKRGPKQKVDSSGQFCPRESCLYYGWLGRGNLQANGHPNNGRWRQFHCVWCHKYFSESLDTIFYRRQLPVTTICQVVASLAEGQASQQVARVFTIDPNTVLACLKQAAGHSEAVCQFLFHQLQLSQVQMDELYALLNQIQRGEVSASKAAVRLTRPHRWVWVAMDPVSKLLVAVVVGDRSLAMAQTLVHAVVGVLAPGVVPLFLTDGLRHYTTALVTHFGQWVAVPSRCEQGPQPKPRWLPSPDLLYAQVKKRRRRKRVVGISQQVIFGAPERIKAVLARSGWHLRQHRFRGTAQPNLSPPSVHLSSPGDRAGQN